MQTVIMLGAGPLQVPAIHAAKDAGFRVVCADYNPNAPGFEFADAARLVSTIDSDAVLELARMENASRVITSTSDAPVRTAAFVSEKLGLPTGISYEDARCATFKDEMRARLAQHGVPMPAWKACSALGEFEEALAKFGDARVVKPADSAASRGVILVEGSVGRTQAERLFTDEMTFTRKGVLMVEECVKGPEVSVEAVTVGGETHVLAVTDKLVTEPPHFVELGHSEPSMHSANDLVAIERVARDAIAAIGIVDGPSHTEIKLTERGPVLIEIAARLGGDFITSKLVPLSTGVDVVAQSVRLALGMGADLTPTCARGAAIRFITSESVGTISSIDVESGIDRIPGLEEIEFYLGEGDEIDSPHSSNDRIGHAVCTGDCARDAVAAAGQALGCVRVTVA